MSARPVSGPLPCLWPGCDRAATGGGSLCGRDTSRLQSLYGTTRVGAADLAAAPGRWEDRQAARMAARVIPAHPELERLRAECQRLREDCGRLRREVSERRRYGH